MNEQGLFFDTYAPNNFRASPWMPGQLLVNGELPDKQPTVEELTVLYSKYDTTNKKNAGFMRHGRRGGPKPYRWRSSETEDCSRSNATLEPWDGADEGGGRR
jgi:hypothetical protein